MIDIRKASAEDATKLAQLALITFIESHGHSASEGDINAYTSEKYSASTILDELKNNDNNYHLLFYKNKLAGYSNIKINTPCSIREGSNLCLLDRIYVLKEFYNLKLGKHLLDYNIQLSKLLKQEGMWLYTWIENKRACRFYEKAGFEIIGHADFKISATHSNPNYIMYLNFV